MPSDEVQVAAATQLNAPQVLGQLCPSVHPAGVAVAGVREGASLNVTVGQTTYQPVIVNQDGIHVFTLPRLPDGATLEVTQEMCGVVERAAQPRSKSAGAVHTVRTAHL